MEQLTLQISQLENKILRLRQHAVEESDIQNILTSYGLSVNKPELFQKQDKKGHVNYYRKFVGEYQEVYLVGKNSNANDRLVKLAKANDYWFHTVEKSGSHVIVPALSIKKIGLLPQIKKQAGILALHYSKKRRAFSGDVYVAQKLSLKKKKSNRLRGGGY